LLEGACHPSDQAPAGRFAAAFRRLSDEPGRVRFFGGYLGGIAAYTKEVIGIPMDAPLQTAYTALEEDVKNAVRQHHANHSVISVGLNALLLYPDHAWDIAALYGYEYDPESRRRTPFPIATPKDLDPDFVYAKERGLLEIVKSELETGRRCHVDAVYTQKRDVTRRLAHMLRRENIRVAVLTSDVPPEKREA
jgi:hypothetical protein